ncbi:MAG: VIT domain-containing protein [Candidatus Krumholzibacteriia bacterium]
MTVVHDDRRRTRTGARFPGLLPRRLPLRLPLRLLLLLLVLVLALAMASCGTPPRETSREDVAAQQEGEDAPAQQQGGEAAQQQTAEREKLEPLADAMGIGVEELEQRIREQEGVVMRAGEGRAVLTMGSLNVSGAAGGEALAPPALDTDLGGFDEIWVVPQGEGREATTIRPLLGRDAGAKQTRRAVVPRPEPSIPPHQEPVPGTGCLIFLDPEMGHVALPLRRIDVQAQVTGPLARTELAQTFRNPYRQAIEVEYLFPLPADAAVRDFVLTVGERRIRGIVREREEAQRIYQQARRQGYTASLLDEERPNLFRQRVANLAPLSDVEVRFVYLHTAAYQDGWHEYHLPLAVGERYFPAHVPDDLDIGAGVEPGTGSGSDRDHLDQRRIIAPEDRRPRSIAPGPPRHGRQPELAVTVRIDAGVPIEDLESVHHPMDVASWNGANAELVLEPGAAQDRDLVVRWKVAGDELRSAVFTHRGQDGDGYWTMVLYAPDDLPPWPRPALDLVFLVDASGSMDGEPLEQVKRAVGASLGKLQEGDRFAIVAFSNQPRRYTEGMRPANGREISAARHWVDALHAGGGTEMVSGLREALAVPAERGRQRYVVLLTDGFIGNESEAFAAVHRHRRDARVFAFGVGSSVNRHLMEGVARAGQGLVSYLALGESSDRIVDGFFERARRPMLTDLELEWTGVETVELRPAQVPPLYEGSALVLTGRYRLPAGRGGRALARAALTVVAHEGGTLPRRMALSVDPLGSHGDEIAVLWARRTLQEWSDRLAQTGDRELPGAMCELALSHGLVSSYTSFVAVDASERVGVGDPVKIEQPTVDPHGSFGRDGEGSGGSRSSGAGDAGRGESGRWEERLH